MKISLLGIILCLYACAPPPSEYDGVPEPIQQATDCAVRNGSCTKLDIDNSNFNEAKIYLNGSFFAVVGGMTHPDPFWIPDQRLAGGRCITLSVMLSVPGTTGTSSKECVGRGGRFEFRIDPSGPIFPLHLWLVPRGGE